MDQLPTILGALVLAAILWVVKTTSENTKVLTVLQTTVERNIMPELERLRDASHLIRDSVHGAMAKTELLDQRVSRSEDEILLLWKWNDQRHGPADRRAEGPTT